MKRLKQIMLFAFIVLIAFGIGNFVAEATSKLEEPIIIRVGYNTNDISLIDEKGKMRGYLFDYLTELKRYGNFKYEFVKVPSDKQLELLQNKKIDLLFFVNEKQAKLNGLELSSLPWSNIKASLCVLDEKYEYEDFEKFSGLKVGYLENYQYIDDFKIYEAKNHFSTELKSFKNIEEIKAAFKDGIINAAFFRIIPQDLNFKIIGKINTPVDFVASYKDSEILKSFDIAMRKFVLDKPKKPMELIKKHYPSQTSIKFSKAERDLIAENEKIVIAIRNNKRPLSYIKNGVNRGFIPDIINKIAKTSGLNFEFKVFGKDATIKEIESDKDVDFLVVDKLFERSEELSKSTLTFYKDYFMFVLRQDEVVDYNKSPKIALIARNKTHKNFFSKWFNNEKFIEFATIRDVLDAIEDKKVNAGIILESRGSYLLKSPYYENLVLSGPKDEAVTLGLKMTKASGQKYLPILNKTITMLKENRDLNIIMANIDAEPYDLSIAESFYKYSIAISLAVILIILVIVLYIREHKQNNALNEANKKAKAASIAKSEFLANMSHELRTPLNAVIGLNYLLKDSLNNYEVAKDYLNKMDQSSQMLLSIINDILDMSAIESGKLNLAREKFNIKDSIYLLTELYYRKCIEKGILYEASVSRLKNEIFIGDSYRFRQIVINLLSNAIKFTERGGKIKFALFEEKVSDKKSIVKIVISDIGCGMSDEFKKRLFGEFEQEDATIVRKHGGSGLGLAICKKLVNLMRGTISLESSLNEGSTFTVKIPFEVGEKLEFTVSQEMANLDVLLVDDDLETCRYISSILDGMKIKNEYATNSSVAIERVKTRIKNRNEYNLFIINLKTPELNGIELVRKIRAMINVKKVMIIIVCYDSTEVKLLCDKCGVDCILRKPVFPSELYFTIESKIRCKSTSSFSNEADSELVLENMKILLTEDNSINELIVRKFLEKAGASVIVAKNGLEALNCIKTNKDEFDVVLMDIQMPIMNGYEATKKIRAINSNYTKNLPIYAITANSFQIDVEKSLENGMNGHISKPIKPEVLFKILSEVRKNRL